MICHPCHHIGPETTCPQCGRETVPDAPAPMPPLGRELRLAVAARGPEAVLNGLGRFLSPREQIEIERQARAARGESAPSWRRIARDK